MGVRDHWGYSGYNTTEISEKNETQKTLLVCNCKCNYVLEDE